MLYLAWDIDGTLLLTNRAGYDALQEAISDYFFTKEPYVFKHTLAGCTDSSIIKEIVTDIKGSCTSGWAAGLLLKYEMYLKQNLKLHKGHLMPNVEKTLQYIQENNTDITNLLLTGNTTIGARDKVTEYGIARYFDFRHGGYGDLAEERDEVARILYTRLLIDGLIQQDETDKIIVIGDTPSDAKCAAAIGARCIIVLAGSEYKPEDFSDCPPWKIWEQLPDDPAEFKASQTRHRLLFHGLIRLWLRNSGLRPSNSLATTTNFISWNHAIASDGLLTPFPCRIFYAHTNFNFFNIERNRMIIKTFSLIVFLSLLITPVSIPAACAYNAGDVAAVTSGNNCPGADLSGADLIGADLTGLDLTGANLQGANLTGARLERAILNKADLQNTKLKRAVFSEAQLADACLRNVEAPHAYFGHAVMTNTDLSNGNFFRSDFRAANLAESTAYSANFQEVTFDKADLSKGDFSFANFSYSWLFQADLSDSLFAGANLYEINGNGLKAQRTNFTSAKLGNARLAESDFSEAVFEKAMLDKANLKGSILNNTVWGTAFKEKAMF